MFLHKLFDGHTHFQFITISFSTINVSNAYCFSLVPWAYIPCSRAFLTIVTSLSLMGLPLMLEWKPDFHTVPVPRATEGMWVPDGSSLVLIMANTLEQKKANNQHPHIWITCFMCPCRFVRLSCSQVWRFGWKGAKLPVFSKHCVAQMSWSPFELDCVTVGPQTRTTL